MERYFLNIRHRDSLVIDEEGSLHADFTAAYDSAVAGARELLGADIKRGIADLNQSIIILDGMGTVLAEVEFATVLTIIGLDMVYLRECVNSGKRSSLPSLSAAVIGADIRVAP